MRNRTHTGLPLLTQLVPTLVPMLRRKLSEKLIDNVVYFSKNDSELCNCPACLAMNE